MGTEVLIGRQPRKAELPQRKITLAEEEAFLRSVWLERRRSERSRRPFVLMLLRFNDHSEEQSRVLFSKCLDLLQSSVRETDLIGWFQEGTILGGIFAEFGDAPLSKALAALDDKIRSGLATSLEATELLFLDLRWQPFPEEAFTSNGHVTNKTFFHVMERVESRNNLFSRAVKRVIDVTGSLVGCVLLAPVFAICSLAVKLSSRGPVLFRQSRVGRFGKDFTFLKFRTMHAGNDCKAHRDYVHQFIRGDASIQGAGESVVYKLVTDPRVTVVGRFLRRTSLDELPQLLNVLRGEMSLVGPRPPIRYELDLYQPWHHRRVLDVKPGITGLWQVTGRSRTKFDEMVRLDLQYARNWSIWLDIKILLQTPRAVLSGEGAY